MDSTQPVQQTTPAPYVATPPPPPPVSQMPPNNSSSSSTTSYLIALLTLLIGAFLGYFLSHILVAKQELIAKKPEPISQAQQSITLPADAIQVQACSDKKGALYVRPADIPVGPVYLVHNQKVIGIEYMLGKDEFLEGKSYKYLHGAGVKVNYVNVGLVSQGHEGYVQPHYHVDLFVVNKEIPESIKCPTMNGSTQIATPEATITQPSPTISPQVLH